jgi:hypothetical protein
MAQPDRMDATEHASRIARLEARVGALERALARLSPPAPEAGRDAPGDRPALAAEPGPETRLTLDRLGITAAFAALDARVVAEVADEQARRFRPVSFDLPEIVIDPSLIDQACAPRKPEKIEVRSHLEALHPRIVERLTGTWRTPELLGYLKRLIVDERGDRAGFCADVMSELLLLSAVLETPGAGDAWDANARLV